MATFISMIEHFSKANNFLTHTEFSFDHPVEEIGRVLLAVLIKHQGLGYHVLSLIDKCKKSYTGHSEIVDSMRD